jgi:preprotein translocase subunit SecE
MAHSTGGDLVTTTRTEAASPRSSGGRGGRPTRFVRESISELRKVLWPSRNELVTYSIVVIVFVVIMVAIVAGLDIGFAKLVVELFG